MPKLVKVEGKIISVPDDATPDEIDAIANGKPANAPAPHDIKAKPPLFSKAGLKEAFYNLADRASNAFPAIGGIGGGILGGAGGSVEPGAGTVAGATLGAAAGGAAGESARQLVRSKLFPKGPEAHQNAIDAVKDIGGQALEQGAYELGGQAIGRAGHAIAPTFAEAALAPGKRLLKSIPEDVNIGRTALDETNGLTPKVISKQLDTKIANASGQVDDLLEKAGEAGKKVPLTGARKLLAGEGGVAARKNAPDYIRDVNSVGDQLKYEHGANGKPIMVPASPATKMGAGFVPIPVSAGELKMVPKELPEAVDPLRARALRQGIDLTIGNWDPESQSAIRPLQERVYGAMTGAIHEAVPETAPLDKRMAAMIPTRDAAWNTGFNPNVTRSVLERLRRPTGALVGGIYGADKGAKEGGAPGAVVGGLAGLAGGDLITSPRGMMGAARLLNSAPTWAKYARYAIPVVASQVESEPAADNAEK